MHGRVVALDRNCHRALDHEAGPGPRFYGDLKYLSVLQQNRHASFKFKIAPESWAFASVPLIQQLASERAASGGELDTRATAP
jgi:hypothetical protein